MKKILKKAIPFLLILSLLLICGFSFNFQTIQDVETELFSNNSTTFTPYIEDGVVVRTDSTNGSILSDNSVFTQEDVDTHFVHYSSGDSRISLPNVYTSIDNNISNVVGTVLDFETDIPIPNAYISANGTELVHTDSSGRFQITNLPDGTYDWEVTADGYMKGSFINYKVSNAGGSSIFRFYLSHDTEYFSEEQDYESCLNKSASQTSIEYDSSLLNNSVSRKAILHENPPLSKLPDAYDTVLVKINNVVKSYSRHEYLCYTIKAEQYHPIEFYEKYYDFSPNQLLQLYCAQAVVSNTFIEFQQKIYLRHGGDYDILPGTDHAFDPTLTPEAIINGVSSIFYTINGKPCTVILYYKPSSSSYQYLNAEWFSACKNQGTKTTSWPGIEAKSCSDLFEGKEGHRRGYCQSGGAQLIKDGEVAIPSAKYYFTNTGHDFALLVPRPKDLS